MPITDHAGLLFALSGICALFFWLERRTGWRLFQYVPPLIFIYLVPVILSSFGVIPSQSPAYDVLKELLLPMMLVLLLLKVDVAGAVRTLGRGVGVMLFGTLGVMVGAPLGLLAMREWLDPDAWKAFGVLAGSWIGGTGNMVAVSVMIDVPDQSEEYALAILADSTIYMFWIPILLISKNYATQFAAFSKVDSSQLDRLDAIARENDHEGPAPTERDILSLLAVGFAATWIATLCSTRLPVVEPYLSTDTWRMLLITTIGIGLSLTSLRRIAGSHQLAMALVYLFVARMGATADLSGISGQVLPFLGAAMIWIVVHGVFCLIGAKLFRVDVHTAALASAANIGGAASATIVASYHRESLVPAGILMALVGYAVGNFAAYGTALLCNWVS